MIALIWFDLALSLDYKKEMFAVNLYSFYIIIFPLFINYSLSDHQISFKIVFTFPSLDLGYQKTMKCKISLEKGLVLFMRTSFYRKVGFRPSLNKRFKFSIFLMLWYFFYIHVQFRYYILRGLSSDVSAFKHCPWKYHLPLPYLLDVNLYCVFNLVCYQANILFLFRLLHWNKNRIFKADTLEPTDFESTLSFLSTPPTHLPTPSPLPTHTFPLAISPL